MDDPIAAPAESVTALLGADHRRLDSILADVRRHLAAQAPGPAAARFAEFRSGLERHIAVEEEALFPAFEAFSGMAQAGPTRVMRMEHAEIRRLMTGITSRLERAGEPDCADSLSDLTALLSAHNAKEERILYPMTDEALTGAPERAEVLRRIREL